MRAVVGRDAELAVAAQLLDRLSAGSGALVVAGAAGIGKTTVWQAAVHHAEARGMRVLRSRPGASETRLTYSGLLDLLGEVDRYVLARLPAPQQEALDVALLRLDRKGAVAGQRSIAAGFLSAVRILAESAPLVIAIDDVQWLDLPTWHVVEYAMRRLDREPVALVAAVRLGDGISRVDVGTLPRERVTILRLGPLNIAALHAILRDELGRSFTRPTLVRIERATGGNAFFALELARAIVDAGAPVSAAGRLPVPEDLAELLTRRLRRLPAATQWALLLASALAQPTTEVLDGEAIVRAVESGVVRVDDRGRVSFAHPLLAASVYHSAAADERRRVHRALADRASDPEERARHLALASEGPDEAVAAALMTAARAARERGAPEAAIELVELACALTPPVDSDMLFARKLELGRTISAAGDPPRAKALLEELLREAQPGIQRARVIVLLSFVTDWIEGGEAATALCETALAEVATESQRAEIHTSASRMCDHDPERKAFHARAALELLSGVDGDPRLRAYALLALAEAEFYAGRGVRVDILDEAAALEATAPPESLDPVQRLSETMHVFPGARPSNRLRGILSLYADQLDTARAALEVDRRGSIDYGDEAQHARTLGRLATLELRAGNWALADRHLQDLAAVVQRTEQNVAAFRELVVRAELDALQGRADAARAGAAQALRLASSKSWAWETCESHAVLGIVEHALGDILAAHQHFDRAHAAHARLSLRDPGFIRYQADRVEALIAAGELDLAEAEIEPIETQARSLERPSALAAAARCRALLSAAHGDLEGALAAIDAACAVQGQVPLPLETARTLLVKGQIHRRRKEKGAARESLTSALEIFERLGSPPWIERARGELARIGLAKRDRDALSSTEEQIASLAATGLTNRAIAERAFLSPKTVEANLARIYQKLGIHSRAELGRAMVQRERAAAK